MGESSRKFNIQTTYCKIIHNVACDKLEDGATLNLHQEDLDHCPIPQRQLYLRFGRSGRRLYTWVSEEEFEYLSGATGGNLWSTWLSAASANALESRMVYGLDC
mmetsp:Transcript_93241/g.301559  ORF Transcript_93241/g.301559 Transcript_93241/m.301559 type:complete len:104 (+) Transcript_93241:648-959(+)